MIRRLAILATWLLLVTPASAIAAESEDGSAIESAEPVASDSTTGPYGVCLDEMCRVSDEPRAADPEATDGSDGPTYTADEDAPGRIVCDEGAAACRLVDAATPVEELLAVAQGRLVYAASDGDPVGEWTAINLPARMRCKIAGAGTSVVKVKRTKARLSIERAPDGRLMSQSRREGESPFELVRLGPGLYGSIQPFSDGKVTGEIISYFGMLDDDTIEVTARITSTLRDGGARTDCTMKRNLDLARLPATPADEAIASPTPVDQAAG